MRRRLTAIAAVAALTALGASEAVLAHDGNSHGNALQRAGGGAHAKLTGARMFDALGPVVGYSRAVEYVSGDNGFTGGHVVVEGKRLYVGSYGRGMRAYDIDDPAKPRFIGEYIPGGPRADAPPDAAVLDGRHIVVLNGTSRTSRSLPSNTETRTDRTEFLDFTNPAKPRVLYDTKPNQVDGESHNGDIVDERLLYFPSGGRTLTEDGKETKNGLRIYDLSPLLEEPARAPRNIGRWDPVELWRQSPYRGDKPVGRDAAQETFTHTHDIEVYTDHPVRQPDGTTKLRDIALLAEGGDYAAGNNRGSVFVIDVTVPEKPVVLQRWLHAQGGTHHPIRYHHEAQLLDGDPSVMLVTDEDLHGGCGGAGGVTAVRLSPDLESAEELSEWFIPLGTPAPVCSVHVFSSKGDTVYFGSYNAGLQVVDYKRPRAPKQAGYYIAEGTTAWGALYHKGYVYVGDMSRGLDVFQFEGDKAKKPKKPKQSRTRARRGR